MGEQIKDNDSGMVIPMIAVHRWYHPIEEDWVSIVDTEASDEKMKSWGYTDKKLQFFVWKLMANNDNMVAVNRWYHPVEKDWVSIADNEASDENMNSWGYTDKKFQFYAWRTKENDNMVAVNRWYHPVEKDWVSIADNEVSDENMKSWGYTDKKFQFYAILAKKVQITSTRK